MKILIFIWLCALESERSVTQIFEYLHIFLIEKLPILPELKILPNCPIKCLPIFATGINELQEKLYEFEQNKKNNLIFYGISNDAR